MINDRSRNTAYITCAGISQESKPDAPINHSAIIEGLAVSALRLGAQIGSRSKYDLISDEIAGLTQINEALIKLEHKDSKATNLITTYDTEYKTLLEKTQKVENAFYPKKR